MSDSSGGTSFLDDFFAGLAAFFGGIVDSISRALESFFSPGASAPVVAEAPAPVTTPPTPAPEPFAMEPVAMEPVASPPTPAPDPFAMDPFAMDPFAMDPFAMDPFASPPTPAPDPFAMDPFAMEPFASPPTPAPEPVAPAPVVPEPVVPAPAASAAPATTPDQPKPPAAEVKPQTTTTNAASAPTSAKDASDKAADPQPSPAADPTPTDDANALILSGALGYEGKHGTIEYTYGGKEELKTDCSGFVARVIADADPSFTFAKDYRATSSLAAYAGRSPPDSMYEEIAPGDVKAGDLVLFSGHVGIVVDPVDPKTGLGTYIGNQNAKTDLVYNVPFGPKAPWWGKKKPVNGYLRYRGSASAKSASTEAKRKQKGGAGRAGKTQSGAEKPSAKKVTNNDKEIATKASGHVATTTGTTDAHLPVGEGSVATYENVAPTANLQQGSVRTEISGAPVWVQCSSFVTPSDPEHPDHQPGVVSGTYRDEARAASASPDCMVEGEPVVRERDATTQNKKNTTGVVKKPPPPAAKAGKAKASFKLPENDDIKHLAALIYGEATASDTVSQEMLAVGWSVRNRLEFVKKTGKESRYFGDGVSYKSTMEAQNGAQFVAVKHSKYQEFLAGTPKSAKAANAAVEAATQVFNAPAPAQPGRPDPDRTDYMPYVEFRNYSKSTARSGRTEEVKVGNQYFAGLSKDFYDARAPKN